MRLFRDLSPKDREYHLTIARQLVLGNSYHFQPALHIVPLERLIKGVLNEGAPIRFSYGQFIRFRDWPSVFRDCLFLAQTRDEHEARFELVVSLLFTPERPAPRLV